MTDDDDYDMGLVRHEAPKRVWLVKPKSDARFYAVYESEEDAREYVGQRPIAEMAGPYVLLEDCLRALDELSCETEGGARVLDGAVAAIRALAAPKPR